MADSVLKDPNDVIFYQVDWSPWLAGGDTIATSTFIVPVGLVEDESKRDHTTTRTTIWLSGGTVDQEYWITNRVTTAGEMTIDKSFKVFVRER